MTVLLTCSCSPSSSFSGSATTAPGRDKGFFPILDIRASKRALSVFFPGDYTTERQFESGKGCASHVYQYSKYRLVNSPEGSNTGGLQSLC